MKDTIKANNFYKVVSLTESGKKNANGFYGEPEGEYKIVMDGEQIIYMADVVSYEFYLNELEENESFNFCEVFTTRKGNQYIYFRDEEIDKDFIAKIPNN